MRILVVTHHFFEPDTSGKPSVYGSRVDPLARIAAVNAAFVALFRHFGPHRYGRVAGQRLPDDATPERVLDIVVLQAPGKGILDSIGIDPSLYTLELCDGDPMMLGFETQRVLRERAGQYDYYAVIEDDMVIHDPLFFDKLAWFEQQFGTTRLLQPLRYEMAQSGMPALVSSWPIIAAGDLARWSIRRAGQPERLSATWHDHEQSFVLPDNPHVGGFFVSDAQLTHWMSTPWFYDRDTSFVGPLESAMSLSIGRAFDLYKPSAPDPFFLAIEHWGTRYARNLTPPGKTYGDAPLLDIAHEAIRTRNSVPASGGEANGNERLSKVLVGSHQSLNALMRERDSFHHQYESLRNSRSKLLKALLSAILRKTQR